MLSPLKKSPVSRKKKHPEHVNHERWLVSYADFITLLFAFFVVLYASSHVDNKKVAQVSAAIEGGFQQLGVFAGSAPGPPVRSESGAAGPGSGGANKANPQIPELKRMNDLVYSPVSKKQAVALSEVKKELEGSLSDELRNHKVEMRVVPDGLVVSLREVGFFDSGTAKLLPEATPAIAHIAQALGERGLEIRVEGHTDNIPIHNSLYNSNWELSTARATQVLMMLVDQYHLDPAKVSAAGYAEYRPIASNSTDEGRRKNRRIDLVVLSRSPEALN